MMKHHAPPPTRFGTGTATLQAKAAARPGHYAPPATRYGAPTRPGPSAATAQARMSAPPPAPPTARPGTVQRMRTPLQIGTDSVVETWDQYKSSRNREEHAKRLRSISGIVLGTGDVVVGTSNWDDRGEHEDSVEVFRPALEIGRQKTYGISCGEKDAMLSVLETAFHGNYRTLEGEHDRCVRNYFKIVYEKLKDEHGKIRGTVSVDGKDVRQDLTYLDCCDGCFRMIVQRRTRFYGVPDLVQTANKHKTKVF